MQNQQLKSKQARERLQLDQSRHQSIAFSTDPKIDDEKIWMRRFVRHLQTFWNRRLRMAREFRRANKIDNPICSAGHLIREFPRQEDRRLRNPKIGRPLLRLIYAAQERRVFFRREVSVKGGKQLWIHGGAGRI